MHLSKILVTRQKANNPYEIHRALWQMFPGRPDDSRDFLFRIEKQQKDLGTEILMQSVQAPIPGNRTIHITATREYRFSLKNGQRLRFRLRANPIKTISDERGRLNKKGMIKKCRVPLIQEEEQKAWLQNKLVSTCSVETLNVQREPPLYFRKNKEQRSGKIQTVLFDGILMVNDPALFIAELTKGIGPAKAFGCGLLSIAPI